jgi:hypothetical protein
MQLEHALIDKEGHASLRPPKGIEEGPSNLIRDNLAAHSVLRITDTINPKD